MVFSLKGAVKLRKLCNVAFSGASADKPSPGGGGVLDEILDGDVPSRFQKHTRSLYQFFENVYRTLYQFFKNIYPTLC